MKTGNVLNITFLVAILMGLFLIAFVNVNLASDTATMTVDVGNAAPSITAVTLENWGAADDNAITTYFKNYSARLWCNITATDANGGSTLTAYHCNISNGGTTGTPDYDVQYENDSCEIITSPGNTANIRCLLRMRYYAEAGTWTATAYVSDGVASDSHGTETADHAEYYALMLNTSGGGSTQGAVATTFGSISAGANSSSALANISVINVGNTEIDFQINGSNLVNTTRDTLIGVTNVTYNTSSYGSDTYGPAGIAGDGVATPRRLSMTQYTLGAGTAVLNDKDVTGTTHTNFALANTTVFFRIIVPAGTGTGSYTGSITTVAVDDT